MPATAISKTDIEIQDETGFGSIGMNRLDIFVSRYELLRTQEKFSVEVDIDEDAGCVRSIIMKAKGTKIDYRCAKPAGIKAPRQINDTLKHRVRLNADSVVLLQKASAACHALLFSQIANRCDFS